jgi:hypothetical protein
MTTSTGDCGWWEISSKVGTSRVQEIRRHPLIVSVGEDDGATFRLWITSSIKSSKVVMRAVVVVDRRNRCRIMGGDHAADSGTN